MGAEVLLDIESARFYGDESSAAFHRQLGQAQLRYGAYFQRIVTPGQLPPARRKRLIISKISMHAFGELSKLMQHQRPSEAISPFEDAPELSAPAVVAAGTWAQWKGSGGLHIGQDSWQRPELRTFLVIYQRGHQVWADEAMPEVPIQALLSHCLI